MSRNDFNFIEVHAGTDLLCNFHYQIAKNKFKNSMRVSTCMLFLHPQIETLKLSMQNIFKLTLFCFN
jgi:hypothetical protein